MQRGEISSKPNCTAQMQGPATRVPAMPGWQPRQMTRLSSALFILLLSLTEAGTPAGSLLRNTRLHFKCMSISLNNCIIAQPSSNTHYSVHLPPALSYPIISPASRSSAKSPPALTTAFSAAWLNLRRFSTASLSRRALVLLLPEGATPVNSFSLSCGV